MTSRGAATEPGLSLHYPLTIFLGAFLLFQVQPMLAKAILPWFGGSPAVWTTCMLFFQVLLLGGYIYAHLLTTWLRPRAQAFTHIGLLLASLYFLDILPPDSWRPLGHEQPAWRILCLLGANIGVPYLLLSATSPLVQAWFLGARPRRSPYRLYALSNAGSLLALLSYPFIFEPLLPLRGQATLWSALYVLFVPACGACAVSFIRSYASGAAIPPARAETAPAEGIAVPPDWRSKSLWFLLSACGSGLLLATTNQLTLNVSVVPFLWILPLGLYLLSFILCFDDGARHYTRPAWTVFLGFACAGAVFLLYTNIRVSAPLQISMFSLTLFIACMVCHGELAANKPPPEYLTTFYVLVSAGGAFGGTLAAVGAPLLLSGPWEYHLFWLLVPSIMLVIILRESRALSVSVAYRAARIIFLCSYIVFAALLYGHYRLETKSLLATGRNFYGTLQVFKSGRDGAGIVTLMHGQIDHGFQFAAGDPRRGRPVSYYGPPSGAGAAVRTLRRLAAGERRALRIGVVGLGAGIMAAWTLPGERLVFYEINPLVVRLSNRYFTYLNDSRGPVNIVMGDARLSLEREVAGTASGPESAPPGIAAARTGSRPPPLDLLVLDAFNGDAVPLHLLTREAFETYFKRLRPDGVLAVHVTNLFLDLEPLVRGLALGCGKAAIMIGNPRDERTGSELSAWVLVTANEKFLKDPLVEGAAAAWPAGRKTLVFSDQYSNLFRLLKPGK